MLKQIRTVNKGKFTRICNRVQTLCESRASRTLIQNSLSEIDNAYDELLTAHADYCNKFHFDPGDYMKDIDSRHAEIWSIVNEYLKSRADEASSKPSRSDATSTTCSTDHVSSLKLSTRSKVLSIEAKVLDLEIKKLELKKMELQVRADHAVVHDVGLDADDVLDDDPVFDLGKPESSKKRVDAWLSNCHDPAPEPGAQAAVVVNKPAEEAITSTVKLAENKVAKKSTDENKKTDNTANESNAIRHSSLAFKKSIPKIDLPKFSGKYLEWPRWYELFKAVIDSQPLTNTEKMVHLQSSVTGLAESHISGLFYDGNLYPQAMQALKDRFGREQDIVRAVLGAVFKVPAMDKLELQGLENLQSSLHCAVTTLISLGYDGDISSSENLRRLLLKLPDDLKVEWGRYQATSVKSRHTLKDLDDWLEIQVRVLLNCPVRDVRKKRPERSHTVAVTNVSSATPEPLADKPKPPSSCPLCENAHKLKDCPRFIGKTADQRASTVAELKLCFACLGRNHRSRNCHNAKPCNVDGCKGKHHPLIHGSARVFPRQPMSSSSNGNPAPSRSTLNPETPAYESRLVQFMPTRPVGYEVALQVVPVLLKGNGVDVQTFALLDTGAQTSLCSESLVSKLNIESVKEPLRIGTVEGQSQPKDIPRLELDVMPLGDGCVSKMIHIDEVWAVPKLDINVPKLNLKPASKPLHLRDIKLQYPRDGEVQLLIGANVIEAIIQQEVRTGGHAEPVVIRTAFGWALAGPMARAGPTTNLSVHHVAKHTDSNLEDAVHKWWETEAFGTKCTEDVLSPEDKRAVEIMNKTTRKLQGRYEIGLLWKSDDVVMPDNYSMALKRLESTEKSLLRNQLKAEAYDKTFKDYVMKGYAKKLSIEELEQSESSKRWYLPHHAVHNPNKPNKFRVVFDAAAVHCGVSLNSQLLTGPDYLQNLHGVLLRFREKEIAIAADIEAMYHQVRVIEEDQPALSFLWREMNTEKPPDVYQMLVTIFGAKCSPTMANHVLRHTALDADAPTVVKEAVFENYYMDDFLKSLTTVAEAAQMQQNMTKLLKEQGGFHIRDWASNDPDALSAVAEADASSAEVTKALGIVWNVKKDSVGLNVRDVDVEITKRGMLSRISTIFDPLGIAQPALLQGKLLIQSLWCKKLDWDQPLFEKDAEACTDWLSSIVDLKSIEIPRCIHVSIDPSCSQQLHVFADASEKAIAARFDQRGPFQTSGLDFFGPMTVRNLRKTEKRYGLIITCMSTRAIHLEMAYSLDQDSFLLALRRFIARRGPPTDIYSDNGTNFVGGERELQTQINAWNQAEIAADLQQKHINWHFNPPAASHFGGIWERLVQSVKRNLKIVLGKAVVRDEVLSTTLAEIEYVLNSRPITHVSSELEDPEALTPNHLLLGRAVMALPPCVTEPKDIYRKGWKQSQYIADHFWSRWKQEYLPMLTIRSKWNKAENNPKEGTVVLIADNNVPRGHWPLGTIVKVYPGADGVVRVVDVKTKTGTFKRPVHKVCVLEE